MRTTRPPVVEGLSLALQQAASSDTSTSTTATGVNRIYISGAPSRDRKRAGSSPKNPARLVTSSQRTFILPRWAYRADDD